MNHAEQEKKRNELAAEFCRIVKEYRPLALTEAARKEMPENEQDERAVVSLIGRMIKWDVGASFEIAAGLMEDVNCHTEAAKIRKMAGHE